APPLNARCTAFSPERALISSPTRKESVPGPGEEKLSFPGRAFAASMNSRSVDPLTLRLAPTNSGKRASCVTGAKSRNVSYGRFLSAIGLIEWALNGRSRVWPSGAALAAASEAITPDPPGRVSITKGGPGGPGHLGRRARPV